MTPLSLTVPQLGDYQMFCVRHMEKNLRVPILPSTLIINNIEILLLYY